MEKKKEAAANNGVDIFRDTPIRYLGYANEIGESFRYQFPKLVIPSYIVSFGYCFADATTKGYATYQSAIEARSSSSTSESNTTNSRTNSPTLKAIITTTDTLIWQCLASVMIPGATINTIVKASRFAIQKSPVVVPVVAAKWIPTILGLGSIPIIIHPIDHGVDYLMDNTLRKVISTGTSDNNDS